MATPNLDFQNFYSSTLSSTITAADTTIYLDTLPTPSEGYLVIEPDSSTNREVVWYTSKGANFVTVPTSGGRGVGGTTAVAHSSGATVNMNNVAEMWTAIKDGSANTGMHQWFDESFADYVQSGATIAPASGLIASISSGVVYINGRRLTLNNASKTFTASKDTYVDVVALSGSNTATLSYTEVNSGVSGSAPVSNGIHIGMVQTHTASITRTKLDGTDVLGNPIKTPSPTSPVLISNPFKFAVVKTDAQNSSASFAKVTFTSENFDTNNNFASSTYTCPVAGFYQFNFALAWLTNPGSFAIAALYKNGSVVERVAQVNGSGAQVAGGAMLVQCAANDTIEVWSYSTNTVALGIGSTAGEQCYFNGFLVSRT